MHIITKYDSLWAHHLRFLLRVCFDKGFLTSNKDVITDNANTPLSLDESPLLSTECLAWHSEWIHLFHNNEYTSNKYSLSDFFFTFAKMEAIEKIMDEDDDYEWFFKMDASLLKYYESADALGFEGEREFERKIRNINNNLRMAEYKRLT